MTSTISRNTKIEEEKFMKIMDSTQLFFNVQWHIRVFPELSEDHAAKMKQLESQFETEVECDCTTCVKIKYGSDVGELFQQIVHVGKYSIGESVFVCKDKDGSYYSVLNDGETKTADAYWHHTFEDLLDALNSYIYTGGPVNYKGAFLNLLSDVYW